MNILLLAFCILTTAARAQTFVYFVNAATLNMREAPSDKAPIVVKLHAPAAVEVLYGPLEGEEAQYDTPAIHENWIHVLYPTRGTPVDKFYEGWVARNLVVTHRDSVKVPAGAAEMTATNWPLTTSRKSMRVMGRSAATGSRSLCAGARISSSSHQYQRGPRGGCFYYSSSGSKVYVDRSLCN